MISGRAFKKKCKKFIRDYPFIGLLLWLFLLGVIAFVTYLIVYNVSVARHQDVYDSLWTTTQQVGKDIRNREEEGQEAAAQRESLAIAQTQSVGDYMSVEEFLNIGENRQNYGNYFSNMLDFAVLKSYNADTIAYLLIPDTPVSYPVLCSDDNDYYLNHNIDGSEGYPGCLYIENYNSQDMSDAINVIYGHNMSNDTMFGTLNEYDDAAYREAHPYVLLYFAEEVRVYEVVIASAYSNEHLLSDCFTMLESGGFRFDGMNNAEAPSLVARVQEYGAWGAYVDEAAVTADDQLLVMSTCASGDIRYIVAARRIV